jgi:hypothetical protein
MAAVVFAFQKPVPGREAQALQLYRDLVQYLESLAKSDKIESFEPVLLGAHGGQIDGCVFVSGPGETIRGLPEDPKVAAMLSRAYYCLTGHAVIPAYVGSQLSERIARMEALAKAS